MTHRHSPNKKYKKHIHRIKVVLAVSFSALFICIGLGALWVATLHMPDLNSFETRKVVESTKIYDRTGNVLLYDTGANTKRTIIDLANISPYIQKGTIAIEDSNFYNNIGIEPTSIIRAIICAEVWSKRAFWSWGGSAQTANDVDKAERLSAAIRSILQETKP